MVTAANYGIYNDPVFGGVTDEDLDTAERLLGDDQPGEYTDQADVRNARRVLEDDVDALTDPGFDFNLAREVDALMTAPGDRHRDEDAGHEDGAGGTRQPEDPGRRRDPPDPVIVRGAQASTGILVGIAILGLLVLVSRS